MALQLHTNKVNSIKPPSRLSVEGNRLVSNLLDENVIGDLIVRNTYSHVLGGDLVPWLAAAFDKGNIRCNSIYVFEVVDTPEHIEFCAKDSDFAYFLTAQHITEWIEDPSQICLPQL